MRKNDLVVFLKKSMLDEKDIELSDNDFNIPFSHIGLDSLSFVVLLCEVEDFFGCKCDLEQMDIEKITTLNELVEYFCGGGNKNEIA